MICLFFSVNSSYRIINHSMQFFNTRLHRSPNPQVQAQLSPKSSTTKKWVFKKNYFLFLFFLLFSSLLCVFVFVLSPSCLCLNFYLYLYFSLDFSRDGYVLGFCSLFYQFYHLAPLRFLFRDISTFSQGLSGSHKRQDFL